jgi:hypothetical protein
MSYNTGGSAFPTKNYQAFVPMATGYSEGMTLRDYFAAKAMQVVLYQCDCFPDEDWRMGAALDSYAMADAMLKARGRS